MSSNKLVISIILTLILFIFFICYAFQSIQTVDLNLDTQQIESNNNILKNELTFLNQYKNYEFTKDFYLSKLQIILVDHINEKAILWNDLNDKGNKQLPYEKIPDNIKYSNSFLIKLNNHRTLIINCDKLLGDYRERIIVNAYKYLCLKQLKLNPKEINYFPSKNENIYERFLRNKMIESLLKSYENNQSLEDFRFYFEKWQKQMGESYKSVTEYDWYEGSLEYISVKIKKLVEKNFNLSNYIKSKRNNYGFFNKEEEYRLIGMLMILYAEKNDFILYRHSELQNDIYKNLLIKTPYISKEVDAKEIEIFKEHYNKYNEKMKNIIKAYKYDVQKSNIYYDEIISETYDSTFMIDKNYYIYQNYKARLKNKEVLFKKYIIVKVLPYKIMYYFNY